MVAKYWSVSMDSYKFRLSPMSEDGGGGIVLPCAPLKPPLKMLMASISLNSFQLGLDMKHVPSQ